MTLYTMADVADVSIELATEDDKHLPAYDHTYLSNICMCPTWGIIRYGQNKAMSEGGRAMALEAGSAAHEFFAAVRLLEVLDQGHTEHFDYHGKRIFGDGRWVAMRDFLELESVSLSKDTTDRLNFCLTALHTSGFYDDPRDKKRTLSSIEESCIAYFDKWPWGKRPVWIRNTEDPTTDIGVECAVHLVITYTLNDGTEFRLRYTGRADGLHHRSKTDSALVVHENKTGARIDKTWLDGMKMTHQITGYTAWATVFSGVPCDRAVVHGMVIPLPKSFDFGGILDEPIRRHEHHFHSWLEWILFGYQIDRQYIHNPLAAPKFTHSCTRYFRSCSFMPLCNSPREEQPDILHEMVIDEWDPLAESKA